MSRNCDKYTRNAILQHQESIYLFAYIKLHKLKQWDVKVSQVSGACMIQYVDSRIHACMCEDKKTKKKHAGYAQ